ncbi:hypothetical protein [Sneathiella sp.]|jgi:flagellar protein FliO/FliZ|uniref:hypothetical protein n=1 Tax=Sneathiella sp. TaxID=1964365 RepID=UPI0039E6EA7F
MELLPYIKYIAVLILVLGLIGLLTLIARKFGMVAKADGKRGEKKRLGVTQVASVDAKRKLVLVRRDDQEHLLLLGPERDLIIEQNIPIKRRPEQENRPSPFTTETEQQEPLAPKLPPLHKRVEQSK